MHRGTLKSAMGRVVSAAVAEWDSAFDVKDRRAMFDIGHKNHGVAAQ
jgi:hypothetical protein